MNLASQESRTPRLFLCPVFLQIYAQYSIHHRSSIPGREHTLAWAQRNLCWGDSFPSFFSPSGELWIWVLFLGFSLLPRVMSPLVNVHNCTYLLCLISSHFLSTLAHLLQESSLSLRALFLFLYCTSWFTSHTPLLREQTKSSIHSHGGCFKRGTWTGGRLPARRPDWTSAETRWDSGHRLAVDLSTLGGEE